MKRAVLLIVIISFLTIGMPADEKELIKKGRKLFDEGKYVEALDMVNKGVTEFGETEPLQIKFCLAPFLFPCSISIIFIAWAVTSIARKSVRFNIS